MGEQHNDDRPRLHVEEGKKKKEKKKLAARKRENEDEKENEKMRAVCRCEEGGESMAAVVVLC